MRRILTGLLLALLPVCFLPGQASPVEWKLPVDTLTEAVLGVAEFRFIPGWKEAPVAQSFLGKNLARLFLERVREIHTHEIDDRERRDYAMSIIHAEKLVIQKKLNELRSARDALYFPGIGIADSSRQKSIADDIEVQTERLLVLSELEPEGVELIPEKKLVFLKKDLVDDLLPPVMDQQAAAAKGKVDYLLWGTVREEAAGLLSLTVSLYASRPMLTLFSGRVTGSLGEFDRLVDRLFFRMATALAGRPWAILDISTAPSAAYIYVDGELAGIGAARLAYVRPGNYRLSFYADGFEVFEERITLEPESRGKKHYELASVSQETVLLTTIPPGADVYLGALKKGVTPLAFPLGATPDILSFSLDGYKSKVLPSTAKDLAVPHELPRDIISWDERVSAKRAEFYRSLGFLVLSVPIPVVLYGAYQNQAFGFLQYTGKSGFEYDKAMTMEKNTKTLYYAYFGSLFLTGSLFVNTMQKLMDYIRTGEESQRHPEGRGKEKEKEKEKEKTE